MARVSTDDLLMIPEPGERVLRHVGDRLHIELRTARPGTAFLRTTIGRGSKLLDLATAPAERQRLMAAAAWRDVPMRRSAKGWEIDFTLSESGFFQAKAYLRDADGRTHWPLGRDLGIKVHPGRWRNGNTIYCAFPRMLGPNKRLRVSRNELFEDQLGVLDRHGYTVIPPSGKLRDVARAVPHMVDRLGCRIVHLLPVSPVPTTYARFGRFGSPYAAQDFTAIDPALVEFDQRTTATDQFHELTHAVHAHDAAVFLDVAANHTGWGSALQEAHPEWFVRNADGTFHSPGAWGNTWADLVELDHRVVALWDHIADALLVWCHRGVDGFRCDAGYMIPTHAWRAITARVLKQFPETVFLLEGLGGPWDATESLLTDGGMQWAYSEMFQNYDAQDVVPYDRHAIAQNRRIGVLVNYSETHDNDRLAARGRTWSLLRNRLCALTSHAGAFGFTAGVEWLADEKLLVHEARGLRWDNPENIVDELAGLNRLLCAHPCFREDARCYQHSSSDEAIYILERVGAGGERVVVVANLDAECHQQLVLDSALRRKLGPAPVDLLGQKVPRARKRSGERLSLRLPPGHCACLSAQEYPLADNGEDYRRARLHLDRAVTSLAYRFEPEQIGPYTWRDLAALFARDPARYLAAILKVDADALTHDPVAALRAIMEQEPQPYGAVVVWREKDHRRLLCVPCDHWVLICDEHPFRVDRDDEHAPLHATSVETELGHVVALHPHRHGGVARFTMERYHVTPHRIPAQLRLLPPRPNINAPTLGTGRFLLTNARGGMCRVAADMASITSKYDCILAANIDPRWPVDRHVFVKRLRCWLDTEGFTVPLDGACLLESDQGPPAEWRFAAEACDGRSVPITATMVMVPERNAVVVRFRRESESPPGLPGVDEGSAVRLIVRVDLEDRSFHQETVRSHAAEAHFRDHCTAHDHGFTFAPAADRTLAVGFAGADYHPQEEWSVDIPHPVEASRGQRGTGDAWSPGWFAHDLAPGEEATLVLDAEDTPADELAGAFLAAADVAANAAAQSRARDPLAATLAAALPAYVVEREGGRTVIAGYPWFLDWGRDTFICARGLLAAGWSEEVLAMLATFGAYVEHGTLPNCIHGEDLGNRDTSDAPLWYALVVEEAAALHGPAVLERPVAGAAENLDAVCRAIALGYRDGTPNGIRLDHASGLIFSPAHFTWMDTNYPAGTPREGYPIEIQVLWIRLLRRLIASGDTQWEELCALAERSLIDHYWAPERGHLADCINARPGQPAAAGTIDGALRSNCIFAVSLGVVTGTIARRTIAAVADHLVVPGALRSLAPLPVSVPLPIRGPGGRLLNDPHRPYWGRYQGDEDTSRKPAYHNGTAWTWPFPSFCEAMARAWSDDPDAHEAAIGYLGSSADLLRTGCRDHLPEILDGDAPHHQRGCDAQAWGATEALRVWLALTDED